MARSGLRGDRSGARGLCWRRVMCSVGAAARKPRGPVPASSRPSAGSGAVLLGSVTPLPAPPAGDLKSSWDMAVIRDVPCCFETRSIRDAREGPPGAPAAQLSLALSVSLCCCCLYAYCKLILMCANAIILQKLKSSLNL